MIRKKSVCNCPRLARSAIATVGLILAAAPVLAQTEDRFAGVEVTAENVSGSVYMLTGAGGNIGASVGEDGTLIIDDQFAPLAERIVLALTGIHGDAPRIILNTHFHSDHTGGNPVFGEIGTIVAHENVRLRLVDEDGFPARGLPVLTFDDHVDVHFNGDTLQVIHMPAGHTDGDSVVYFQNANVLHTGDLLFNGGFPFIDQASGGTVAGVVASLTKMLETFPDDVKIIPGHGALATKDNVRDSVSMIEETQAAVQAALGRGLSVDEVVSEGLDDKWAPWGEGFIDEERWIRMLAAGAGMAE